MYQKLKDLRKKKGFTTQDMADKLGISKPFYSQIENQVRKLSYDMAIKIAAIFDKKPDAVFFIDHQNESIDENV